MLTSTTPLNRPLGNGLVMKSVADARDVERIGAFDIQVFGQEIDGFAPNLILHHPATRPEHWLYIEEEATGQIVSSLALIPWEWHYEDVTLKSGEVGIVGTLEAYRNRGLVRALMARHRELLQEGDFDLSHIQGIPYYYRQFGYEYALPLEAHWNVELRSVPDKSTESAYHFRLATVDDIPALMRFYEAAEQQFDIRTVREPAVWPYLLGQSMTTPMAAETWMIVDDSEQAVGYFRVPFEGFGTGLIVSETSRMNFEIGEAVLHHLKTLTLERNKTHIRLNLAGNNDLVRVAHSFGGHNEGCYQWQISLVDVGRTLRKLTPVLERRIAGSIYTGLTRTVCINLYREAFELHFEQGRLTEVKAIGFSDQWGIKIPPLVFVPLLLGYKSREELSRIYPDVSIGGQERELVDVLFPKLESFLYTIY